MNKSRFYQITSLVAVLVSALVLTACELTPAEQQALNDSLSGDQPAYAGAPPAVASSCFNERFVQPDAKISNSVDLLFVTDTSGSLDDERASIADGIDYFVSELPEDVDYQIAVMLAHGSRSNHSGRLWKYRNNPYVLDSRTMSISQIRSGLRQNLTHTSDDRFSDGGEEGMYSLLRGLDNGGLQSSRAKGFFRQDAALAVVFISDENDICARYPQGVERVYDPEGNELPAFDRDCAGVTPDAVLKRVKEVQGDRPFLIGGIVYNNDNYPRGGENEYGYGYMDLINLAHGISIDMAGGHYDTGLSDIGRLVTTKLNLVTDFNLAHQEIDPASIEVYVDGQSSEFDYVSATNQVHVDDAGTARSTVDIDYCLKQDPAPTPSVTPTPDPSPSPSVTPTPDPSPSPSVTPTPDPSPSPSVTPTPDPSPSVTPDPCAGTGCGGGVIGS